MEVNKSYIEFLLQLLNNDENIDIENHQEELIVNLYLTLLSLSNLEYSEKLDQVEKELGIEIFGDTKVKISLVDEDEETWDILDDKTADEISKINTNYINEEMTK